MGEEELCTSSVPALSGATEGPKPALTVSFLTLTTPLLSSWVSTTFFQVTPGKLIQQPRGKARWLWKHLSGHRTTRGRRQRTDLCSEAAGCT